MKTNDIRRAFLKYFEGKNHKVIPSSSLIPGSDPTLLFTNAGMVQFKNLFLGEKTGFKRAASVQRCVRAGGKHNDLENVGYTARHHTFFEMLGNFSFGDYFKREAIQYAWDFLTNVLQLPKEKLWVTVYEEDSEAADIWLNEIKVDSKRFSRCGKKDNFWSMGDTGPCGPCTEIFYDHGPEIFGGPPGSKEEDGDRYVEIWNLVFMQYNRGNDGVLTPLPMPSVDTGMGLERVAAALQGVHNNYDIDIFQYLIQAIKKLAPNQDKSLMHSLRVIADHIRACSFLVMDGVIPSNEGRGYVLRRIIRRAVRHGQKLGFQAPFFYQLVTPLAEMMGEAYPEIKTKQEEIKSLLHQEELQFDRTLEQGLRILEQDLKNIDSNTISGKTIFKLYDTYGFPVDLTGDIAREKGLMLDMDGFNEMMALQKTRAREASQFAVQLSDQIEVPHVTEFTGYERLEERAEVMSLYLNSEEVKQLEKGDEGMVVLNHTPFYAAQGGQVGDQGLITFSNGEFEVKDTKKVGQAHMHYGVLREGSLKVGSQIQAMVDKTKRRATALNHSATHLLHSALRKILGNHVQQKGSLVEPGRLRFDFSHPKSLTKEEIRAVEQLVNEEIRQNSEVITELMPMDKALESGAVALFGEKYDREKPLRVLRMGGDFSVELCGGTHVKRTGDIGGIRITSQSSISAGVRRIEAVTGVVSENYAYKKEDDLEEEIQRLQTMIKELKSKKMAQPSSTLGNSLLSSSGLSSSISNNSQSKSHIENIGDITLYLEEFPESASVDIKDLRERIDQLKKQYQMAVIILATVQNGKVVLVGGLSPDCIKKYGDKGLKAGTLLKEAAKFVGGQGGGRDDMAQGGGNDPKGIEKALKAVEESVKEIVLQKQEPKPKPKSKPEPETERERFP